MPGKRASACQPTVCMCVCPDMLFKDLITHSGGVPLTAMLTAGIAGWAKEFIITWQLMHTAACVCSSST